MDRLLLVVAILAAAISVYPLAVYPLLVSILAQLRPRPWRGGAPEFPVAHIIAVHNEERRIRRKLENALAVRYPGGSTDLVVASDGSTDGTEAIVAEFASRGVRWIGCPRRGKENAQLTAIRSTAAPVIVFSDASTTLEPGSVGALLEPFADPNVGAASGVDIVEAGGKGTGEDLYVKYEMALRRAESLAGSLVGLSGSCFAVRREIAEDLRPDVPSDLGAALLCLERRLRAVHVDDALCTYTATPTAEREFARKRRTALRGMRGLLAFRRAFDVRRPVTTWQLVSHKLLRFSSPVFAALTCVAIGGSAIAGSSMARLALFPVVAGIALGAVAIVWAPARRVGALRALGFWLLSNCAVGAAIVDLAAGRRMVVWAPTSRHR